MTDHEPALPPELATALRRWAAATDPASDPVGGPAVRAGATGRARWTSHRALLVAAAVIVALLAASAVWAAGRDDPDTVITHPDPADVGRVLLKVIVDSTGRDPRLPAETYSVTVEPDCAAGETCPELDDGSRRAVLAGASVVLAEEVPQGSRWVAIVETWPCGSRSCPGDQDGSPLGEDQSRRLPCRVPFTADRGDPVVIEVSGDRPSPGCQARPTPPVPRLTIPEVFSRREALPWSCGTGAWPAVDVAGIVEDDDPAARREAWACFRDAFETGERIELPVADVRLDGEVHLSWWRVEERGFVVIYRAPPPFTGGRWTAEPCNGLGPDGEDGSLTGTDCLVTRELGVAEAPPGPIGGGPLDLTVTLADGPTAVPADTADRWVVTAQGEVVASGPLPAGSTTLATSALRRDGDTTVRWDRFTCAGPCAPPDREGIPQGGYERVTTLCEQLVGGPRVAARFQSVDGAPGGVACEAPEVEDLPALTVPPAWSLRVPFPTECGAEGAGDEPPGTERSCLVEAAGDGSLVELTTLEPTADGGTRPVVWRVSPGTVVVTRPPVAVDEPWRQTTCVLLRPVAPPAVMEPAACAPEEVMGLDPP